MYLLEIKRAGNNRLTGSARYRVKSCTLSTLLKKPFCQFHKELKSLFISSAVDYQEGCFVNPSAVLKFSIVWSAPF